MKILCHPFDFPIILKKKKSIKKELIQKDGLIKKRIAVVGGSTLTLAVDMLEVFLLNQGIEPLFFVGEYNGYFEELLFSDELVAFSPEIIYIHTNNKNISQYPEINANTDEFESLALAETSKLTSIIKRVDETFKCPLIINNYELLPYRLLGNSDSIYGQNAYINRLNSKVHDIVSRGKSTYLNDINYLSALYGLDNWHDSSFYYMYKYAMSAEAIVLLADNIAKIVKAIFGKNKKAIAVDLDNTLWGGVVGDDGVEGIELSIESPTGYAHRDFSLYLKKLSKLGIPLCIVSKNEHDNAIAGLNHPDSTLSPDDFLYIHANWENKDRNIKEIASKMNILPDSFVFLDDNPAERQIVADNISGIAVPTLQGAENFITAIDRGGYFETVALSADDMARNDMYKANLKREQAENSFSDYSSYLKSLEMKATISPFDNISLDRTTQLINKTNQFNTTGLRLSKDNVADIMNDESYLSLYARLQDKFGDNGIVSSIIVKTEGDKATINLWIMSCRVFKRELEYAIFDIVIDDLIARNIKEIYAKYIPTAKNGYIKNLYTELGFETVESCEDYTLYRLDVDEYIKKNKNIEVM